MTSPERDFAHKVRFSQRAFLLSLRVGVDLGGRLPGDITVVTPSAKQLCCEARWRALRCSSDLLELSALAPGNSRVRVACRSGQVRALAPLASLAVPVSMGFIRG